MPKKIFDVIPPQKIKKDDFKKEEIATEEIVIKKYPLDNKEKNNIFKHLLPKILIVVFLILIGAGGVYFFTMEKIKIEIWPQTESFNSIKEVVISANESAVKGEIIKDQKNESQQFPASGKAVKEEKAKGTIKVYNNFSSSPQTLVANTRFVSADGKLFRSLEKTIVPGGSYDDKGKFAPGTIDIEVIAAEPGKEYNIEASTFSIPGFAGTPRYTSVYGKSFSPMEGGFKGEAFQATQSDMEKAEGILIEKLKKESLDSLKKSLAEGHVLLDEAVSYNILEKNFSTDIGEETDSFSLQVKIESEALIFKKSDIEKIAKEVISSNISQNKSFQEDKLEIGYLFKSFEKEEEKIVIDAEIKSQIYHIIDLNEVKKTILGKPFSEVKLFLSDYPGVSKVKIDPGFFFRKSAPNNESRVDLELRLD